MFLLRTVYAPLLLLSLLCSSVLYAQHHEVGGQMISLPAPPGYVDATSDPDIFYHFSQSITDKNRLVGVYLNKSTMKNYLANAPYDLEWNLLVQTHRIFENNVVVAGDFDEMRTAVQNQQSELMQNTVSSLKDSLLNQSLSISDEAGKKIALKVGDMHPLGVTIEAENYLGFAMLLSLEASEENAAVQVSESVVVCAFHMQKGKLFYIYVTAPYTDAASIEKANELAVAWSELIVAANPASN